MVASDKGGTEAGSQTWGLEIIWRTHTRQRLKLEGSNFTFSQIWKTLHSGLKQHIWEYLIWWLWGPLTMMKLELLKLGFWSQTGIKSINGAKIPGFKWESRHQLLLNQWQRQDLIDNMNHILSTNAKNSYTKWNLCRSSFLGYIYTAWKPRKDLSKFVLYKYLEQIKARVLNAQKKRIWLVEIKEFKQVSFWE